MTKKVIFGLLAAVSIVACSKVGENEFIITGEAKGVKDSTNVVLQKQDSTGIVSVDTVKVIDGKFKIEGQVKEPYLHFIAINGIQGGVPLILESGEINVKVDKDSVQNSTVGGTKNNDYLTDYSNKSKEINKKMMAFQKANMEKFNQARATNDTVTMNDLMKKNNQFGEQLKNMSFEHIDKNKDSFLSVYFINQFINQPDADLAKLEKQFNALTDDLKKTSVGKKIKERFEAINNTKVGSTAPDFSAKTPDGKTVSLKQSLGKITIIDFWASWCQPCRQENPAMVALYNEFSPKGLKIIGVSLDSEAKAWTEAIEKDKLTWTQVANLKPQSDPIARKYNISQIPTTYLLDEKGKIIAVNLRGEELKAKVQSLLN
ncbi:redoxin domain-containing protein [Flavobacterium sp.]|uniref:redoxin domain-containing protein n=1 Tax=Flavobacterium sp. TaxID=239 RepID=UPI003B9CFC2B